MFLDHGLHLRAAFRGRTRLGGQVVKSTEQSEPLEALRPKSSTLKFPIRSPRSTPPRSSSSRRTTARMPMCAPIEWRGLRNDGRVGAEQYDHLAIDRMRNGRAYFARREPERHRLDSLNTGRPDPATIPALGTKAPGLMIARFSNIKPSAKAYAEDDARLQGRSQNARQRNLRHLRTARSNAIAGTASSPA